MLGSSATWPPRSVSGLARRGRGDWGICCPRARPLFVLGSSGGLQLGLEVSSWAVLTSLTLTVESHMLSSRSDCVCCSFIYFLISWSMWRSWSPRDCDGWVLAIGSGDDGKPMSSIIRGWSSTIRGIVLPTVMTTLLLIVTPLWMLVCFFSAIVFWRGFLRRFKVVGGERSWV